MLKKWVFSACLMTSAASGVAQSGPGVSARIVAVTEGGKEGRFSMPQVQLSNAAVARRINRRIVELVMSEQTNPKLNVRQQLRQAERTCCYDGENGLGWNTVGQGLTGCNYSVLLNQQGILSLAYWREYTGAYQWEQALHVTFDLRTGSQLTLADLVADPPAQLMRRMHGAISRRFGESLTHMKSGKEDSSRISFVAELFCWDWDAKRVRFASDSELADEASATEPTLENFALTPHELQLYYEPALPHILLHLEPDNTYHFPYARIQPRGLLVPVAKAALAKKQ
jgi:hypothetical protein